MRQCIALQVTQFLTGQLGAQLVEFAKGDFESMPQTLTAEKIRKSQSDSKPFTQQKSEWRVQMNSPEQFGTCLHRGIEQREQTVFVRPI